MTQLFEALRWYVILQLFGLAVLPVALHFFRFLPDRGYAFARPLGLLLVGYALWIGGVFGLFDNQPFTILLLLIFAAGASWIAFRTQIANLRELWQSNRGHILAIEGLFLFAFAIWVFIRAYNPEIQATEKPMEFAFLNATLRSAQLPPLDPWLSGFSISYYYFGYIFIALITSLASVPPAIAFNLAVPTLFALTATGAYSVGYNLVEGIVRGTSGRAEGLARPKRLIGSWFAGACTVFTMLILSNWEIFLELLHSRGIGSPSFWNGIGIQNLARPYSSGQFFPLDAQDNWWWFRASRVIGDYNSADGRALDYTINEFPFFSFILGDVHPHVLALPFVFLTIGYTLNLLRSNTSLTAGSLLRNPLDLAFLAILFGSLWVLNAWDMLTQLFVLSVAIAIARSLQSSGIRANWIYEVLAIFAFPVFALIWAFVLLLKLIMRLLIRVRLVPNAPGGNWPISGMTEWLQARVVTTFLFALLACGIAYFPFYLTFRSQASGAGVVFLSTQWHHFLIFWGPLLFFGVSLLAAQMATGLGGVPMLRRRASGVLHGIAASDWTRQRWIWLALAVAGLLLAAVLEAAIAVVPVLGGNATLALPGDALERILRRTVLLSLLILALTAVVARIWRLNVAEVRTASPDSRRAPGSQARARQRKEQRSGLTEMANPAQNPGGAAVASLAREHIFVLILLFTGLLLIFGTELVFVRDYFNNRMNTVFKLYYQAWTLLAIVAGYTIYYFAGFARANEISIKPIVRRIWLTMATVIAIGGLLYPVGATLSKTAYFNRPATLDGLAWYERIRPEDHQAIKWLNDNVEGSPVILEATGGSYSAFGRVSANTGLPTLLGWDFHEQQWRGSFSEQARRKGDIDILFRTTIPEQAESLMTNYQIAYVYVGPLEKQVYGESGGFGLEKFASFMDIVYDRDGVTIYRSRGPAG